MKPLRTLSTGSYDPEPARDDTNETSASTEHKDIQLMARDKILSGAAMAIHEEKIIQAFSVNVQKGNHLGSTRCGFLS